MHFLCDSDNTIMNMSYNVRKIIGLTKRIIKEKEETLGRAIKMSDLILDMGTLETFIMQNSIRYLPKESIKIRTFNVQNNDSSYMNCFLTYEERMYLKGNTSQFSEKVYVIIPKNKIPDIDNSSVALNSGVQFQSQA